MEVAITGRTAWARNLAPSLRAYFSTEMVGAGVLVLATAAALAWANLSPAGYRSTWTTQLAISLGTHTLRLSLLTWINDGLMAFFFFVAGLELRREFDLGDLRDRRRARVPVVAGLAGMAVPALLYLAIAGSRTSKAFGVVIPTDTAFALAILALVGPAHAPRMRGFMLTLVVLDDLVSLAVITLAYSGTIEPVALAAAGGLLLVALSLRRLGVTGGRYYVPVALGAWLALEQSGVNPILTGLAMGLAVAAYPASRAQLERASAIARAFREQPTAALARSAARSASTAVSPNERLQSFWHPWTSFVIVPLFALANAGVRLDGATLSSAFRSSTTIAIVIGLVLGKPLGILAGAYAASHPRVGRGPRSIAWSSMLAIAPIGGVGFTVSLLIAGQALSGSDLAHAKVGIITAALLASAAGGLAFRAWGAFTRSAGPGPAAAPLLDLDPLENDEDHQRGPADAPVTLVEYGDYECPYCGIAETTIRALLSEFGDELRYVWRHLPLTDVHAHAESAAEAAEAAGAQGMFWSMHDLLFEDQGSLDLEHLIGRARRLGLDVDRFTEDLRTRVFAPRVADDVDSAERSGVAGTPTFFINGQRHFGPYDIDTLSRAVRVARTRTVRGG